MFSRKKKAPLPSRDRGTYTNSTHEFGGHDTKLHPPQQLTDQTSTPAGTRRAGVFFPVNHPRIFLWSLAADFSSPHIKILFSCYDVDVG